MIFVSETRNVHVFKIKTILKMNTIHQQRGISVYSGVDPLPEVGSAPLQTRADMLTCMM